jgi:ankyrin repeat protein
MSVEVSGDFAAALRDLLVSQYDDEDSLKRVLGDMPHGKVIRPHLTYPTSLYGISADIVALSIQHGVLDELKAALLAQRSQLSDVIEQVWSMPAPQPASPPVAARERLRPFVPQPPDCVEERPEHGEIRGALRSDRPVVGVIGLPGSGKTTAAIASLDDDTRSAFVAICWVRSDDNAVMHADDVRRDVARQLGGPATATVSQEELAALAQEVVGDGDLLVVLDELRGRLDQLVDAVRCHPRTRLLVTATDSSVLTSIGARDPVHLAGLPRDAALRVLAWWAGVDAATLPPAAQRLAEAIGYHAEGLRILGATVAGASNKEAEWSYLEGQLRKGHISTEVVPGIPGAHLGALVDQVVDALSPTQLDLLQVLAVPRAGHALPLEVVAVLSKTSKDVCRRLCDDLVRRSLAVPSATSYGLRALVHLRIRERRGFEAAYADVLGRLSPPRPSVIWSIVLGDSRMALHFVEQSTVESLTASTPDMGSALHQAAFHGLDDVVAAILARGADPAVLDCAGSDALQYAVRNGQIDVVRRLLAHGVSPFRPNDGGKDALAIALHIRQLSIAEALVETDAQPAPDTNLVSDLQYAVDRGVHPVVKRLLALGAPCDPDLGVDNTPLLALAIGNNHLAVARLLLQQGAAPFRSETLSLALVFAAQNGHRELVTPLIEAGASVSWAGNNGSAALHVASAQGHADVVRALLAAGASHAQTDDDGRTALEMAAAFHHADVVVALHEAGADVDHAGPGGERSLSLSVLRAGVGASMQSRASTDERGVSFSVVMVITDVDPNVTRTVRALLDAGADVNAVNATGHTALHHAARVMQPALAHELIARGARRDVRDEDGKTPFDVANAAVSQGNAPLLLVRRDALLKLLDPTA